ncbi:MAG: heavy metal translocating P-type ATPase [archaeon]|nr:heavy metal translocating P-type ATPase [archaeon]
MNHEHIDQGMDGKNMEHEMYEEHDFNEHEGHQSSDFKKRFFIALILTIPVLLLSPSVQLWLGISFVFFGDNYVLFGLSSIIVLYTGMPFYKGAVKEFKQKNYGMMTLVTIAVLSGYIYSLGTTFFFTAQDFYWEISTLVLFLLFGHWMEMRSISSATGALSELAKLIPSTANLITKEGIKEISTDKLNVGDIILIKPGEKIPIDSLVIEGETSVNESLITGESKPITKRKGDVVIGGSINFNGTIRAKVNKTGKETVINQIIELVRQAQSSKPKTQRIADKAANYLTLSAVIIGILSFTFWALFSNQPILFALNMAITVIVIACPHALGLAIPIVTTISTTLAAKSGILIRDMSAIETAEKLDYVIFDKTGTLTKGTFEVTNIVGDKKTLEFASAVENYSEHVIAKGIVKKAKESGIIIQKVKNFKAIPGKGAKAIVRLRETYVGNNALLRELNLKNQFEKESEKFASQGKTVVTVAQKDKVIGIIALSDVIREESKEAINELKNMGIKTAMLTGDNKETAKYVANELGIDEYYYEVLPKDKSEYVKKLQEKGKVAMVGDGINDAPALTQADLGIAIGAGTEIAAQSAEVVLVKNNPVEISKLIKLSKKTKDKMRQNLWWAAGYNIVAIPVAAGVLYPMGFIMRPEWGALLMAASSIIVVANSLLLRRFK